VAILPNLPISPKFYGKKLSVICGISYAPPVSFLSCFSIERETYQRGAIIAEFPNIAEKANVAEIE
jgi:hypothetical protein